MTWNPQKIRMLASLKKQKFWQHRVLYYHQVKSSWCWFEAMSLPLPCLLCHLANTCSQDQLLELYNQKSHCSVLTLGSRMKLAERIVFTRDGEKSLPFWLPIRLSNSSSYNGKCKVSESLGIQHRLEESLLLIIGIKCWVCRVNF